jgi:hypothetical protein
MVPTYSPGTEHKPFLESAPYLIAVWELLFARKLVRPLSLALTHRRCQPWEWPGDAPSQYFCEVLPLLDVSLRFLVN